MHYDNPGPPNKRALTCLLYLNPDWKEADGGEVFLTPFLQKEEPIAPLLDRLVSLCTERTSVRAMNSGALSQATGSLLLTPLYFFLACRRRSFYCCPPHDWP